jgi:hypothetical protein
VRLHGEIELTISNFFAVEAKGRSWYEKRKPEREIVFYNTARLEAAL